jgi:hypothetical protein
MGRHDEEPTDRSADESRAGESRAGESRVDPTVDEQVHEVGDEHLGLEGGVDIRPNSAREDLRLT